MHEGHTGSVDGQVACMVSDNDYDGPRLKHCVAIVMSRKLGLPYMVDTQHTKPARKCSTLGACTHTGMVTQKYSYRLMVGKTIPTVYTTSPGYTQQLFTALVLLTSSDHN